MYANGILIQKVQDGAGWELCSWDMLRGSWNDSILSVQKMYTQKHPGLYACVLLVWRYVPL